MTKLILTALLFCSSLSLAADAEAPAPTTAPAKKKPSKLMVDSTGGSTGLGTLGTSGAASTAAPKKAVMVRGTGTAPPK